MTFRLYTVRDMAAAGALAAVESGGTSRPISGFRALHERPDARPDTAAEAEAIVLTRVPDRPGVVSLWSFVDLESAYSFVRYERGRGLDLNLVLVYWAEPVTIEPNLDHRPELPSNGAMPTLREAVPAEARHPVSAQPRTVRQVEPQQVSRGARKVRRKVSIRDVVRWRGWLPLRRRAVLAAQLKESAYEDVEKDADAARQMATLVGMAALAAGLGAFQGGPFAMALHTLASLLSWVVYGCAVYWVGTTIFEGRQQDDGRDRMLVALGYASAPRLFLILAAIPLYGLLVPLLVLCWVTAATVVVCKYLLELDEISALMTAVAGCLALFAVSTVMPSLLMSLVF